MKKTFTTLILCLTLISCPVSAAARTELNPATYSVDSVSFTDSDNGLTVLDENDQVLFNMTRVEEYVYTTERLNLRTVPTTKSKKVTTFNPNTRILRIATSDSGWSLVSIEDKNYFMWDEYLTLNELTDFQDAEIPKVEEKPTIAATQSNRQFVGSWRITGYTTDPSENGGYTTDCKGRALIPWYTCASDLPLGTMVEVEGLGTFEVRDRGVKGQHLDICTNSNAESYQITGYYNVYILN